MKRRDVLAMGGGCLAHLAWGVRSPISGQSSLGRVVAREPWGSLEEIGRGVWGLISTPLEDRTTLCNGGIVSGDTGTLVIEGFGSNQGAAWMGQQARALTGRWPTHVLVTHFHGDHTAGIAGFDRPDGQPRLLITETTLRLVKGEDANQDAIDRTRATMLNGADIVSQDQTVDLGDRSVRLTRRGGHTPSDVSVSVDEGQSVFCGDLVWNHMFPNYRDAIPSQLSTAVRALVTEKGESFVPGHGAMADRNDLVRYVAVIDAVEEAARRAFGAGVPALEAAKSFTLPESLGEWMLFSPRYYEVALGAWERELTG